jgi:hypothetical protein
VRRGSLWHGVSLGLVRIRIWAPQALATRLVVRSINAWKRAQAVGGSFSCPHCRVGSTTVELRWPRNRGDGESPKRNHLPAREGALLHELAESVERNDLLRAALEAERAELHESFMEKQRQLERRVASREAECERVKQHSQVEALRVLEAEQRAKRLEQTAQEQLARVREQSTAVRQAVTRLGVQGRAIAVLDSGDLSQLSGGKAVETMTVMELQQSFRAAVAVLAEYRQRLKVAEGKISIKEGAEELAAKRETRARALEGQVELLRERIVELEQERDVLKARGGAEDLSSPPSRELMPPPPPKSAKSSKRRRSSHGKAASVPGGRQATLAQAFAKEEGSRQLTLTQAFLHPAPKRVKQQDIDDDDDSGEETAPRSELPSVMSPESMAKCLAPTLESPDQIRQSSVALKCPADPQTALASQSVLADLLSSQQHAVTLEAPRVAQREPLAERATTHASLERPVRIPTALASQSVLTDLLSSQQHAVTLEAPLMAQAGPSVALLSTPGEGAHSKWTYDPQAAKGASVKRPCDAATDRSAVSVPSKPEDPPQARTRHMPSQALRSVLTRGLPRHAPAVPTVENLETPAEREWPSALSSLPEPDEEPPHAGSSLVPNPRVRPLGSGRAQRARFLEVASKPQAAAPRPLEALARVEFDDDIESVGEEEVTAEAIESEERERNARILRALREDVADRPAKRVRPLTEPEPRSSKVAAVAASRGISLSRRSRFGGAGARRQALMLGQRVSGGE